MYLLFNQSKMDTSLLLTIHSVAVFLGLVTAVGFVAIIKLVAGALYKRRLRKQMIESANEFFKHLENLDCCEDQKPKKPKRTVKTQSKPVKRSK